MLVKLSEAVGKFVAAVVAGVVSPVLVSLCVAGIKECGHAPTPPAVQPAPAAMLLPPSSERPQAPTQFEVTWRPAAPPTDDPATIRRDANPIR